MSQAPTWIRAVQNTREFARVSKLPRREWTEDGDQDLVIGLTSLLGLPGGEQALRAIQARALYELETCGGLFGPIRVGGGKTLISLLAPVVVDSQRPLLLLPAKLIQKTERARGLLANHWRLPVHLRIESYTKLSITPTLLEDYCPDLIIADECHKLKNHKAGLVKRMKRYMRSNPDTMFCALSGTMTTQSIKDYAHILEWCLPTQFYPLPHSFGELEDWALALDEKPTDWREGGGRIDPGALMSFCEHGDYFDKYGREVDRLTAARKGYRRRLVQTPGVVATTEGFVGCSLVIEPAETDMAPETTDHFTQLREKWTRPDGWKFGDPMQVWRAARQLAMGFYYQWDPPAPEVWLEKRSTWAAACRYILDNNRRNLDTESQVIEAVMAGHYPEWDLALLEWLDVEPTFKIQPKPVWFDDSVVEYAKRWALEHPGIIWVEHLAVGERLAQLTGMSFYQEKGLDKVGRFIEDHPPGEALIASIESNKEGLNLQYGWSQNLILGLPSNGERWEQLLGRTHRDGQTAEEVTVTCLLTCGEHVNAYTRAIQQARYIETTQGQAQKLLYADGLIDPSDYVRPGDDRWRSTKAYDDVE